MRFRQNKNESKELKKNTYTSKNMKEIKDMVITASPHPQPLLMFPDIIK